MGNFNYLQLPIMGELLIESYFVFNFWLMVVIAIYEYKLKQFTTWELVGMYLLTFFIGLPIFIISLLIP